MSHAKQEAYNFKNINLVADQHFEPDAQKSASAIFIKGKKRQRSFHPTPNSTYRTKRLQNVLKMNVILIEYTLQ